MNRRERRAAASSNRRRNANASTLVGTNPIAGMLGYREVALSDIPEESRARLAGYAQEMDDQGIGPGKFYVKPDGTYTVLSAPQSGPMP